MSNETNSSWTVKNIVIFSILFISVLFVKTYLPYPFNNSLTKPKPKFKYGETVNVVEGFYAGSQKKLKAYDSLYNRYYINVDNELVPVKEKYLKALK